MFLFWKKKNPNKKPDLIYSWLAKFTYICIVLLFTIAGLKEKQHKFE